MSLSNCDILHLRMIISTAGIPSTLNRPFIRSSILSFSLAGMRIHRVQSGCASESCLASSFVMNYPSSAYIHPLQLQTTHIKPVPLLLIVASCSSGLVDRCIYSNTHLFDDDDAAADRLGRVIRPAFELSKATDFRAQLLSPLATQPWRNLFFAEADVSY